MVNKEPNIFGQGCNVELFANATGQVLVSQAEDKETGNSIDLCDRGDVTTCACA